MTEFHDVCQSDSSLHALTVSNYFKKDYVSVHFFVLLFLKIILSLLDLLTHTSRTDLEQSIEEVRFQMFYIFYILYIFIILLWVF